MSKKNNGKLYDGRHPDEQDKQGNTLLMLAVAYGRLSLFEELMDRDDLNLDLQNEEGDTALILATVKGSERMVKQLLAAGADSLLKNNLGRDAFWYASTYGNYHIATWVARKNPRSDKDKPNPKPKLWK